MKKEKYIAQVKALNETIRQAKLKLQKTNEEYIETNRKLEIEQIVTIRTPKHKTWVLGSNEERIIPEQKRKAVVVGFKINRDMEVEPVLKKIKKDGTISKLNDYLYRHDKIITE